MEQNPRKPSPGGITSITPMLRRLAAADPDRLAIVGKDFRLSYGGLHAESRRLSANLESLLAGAEDPLRGGRANLPPIVAVCMTTAFDTARLAVAIEAGNRILLVIDTRWSATLQTQLIETTGATAVVADAPALRAALDASSWSGLVIGLSDLEHAGAPPAPDLDGPGDGDPFLMLTSSGTTGTPKAFLKTRAQYAANIDISHELLGARDRIATFAPGPMSYSLTLYTLFEVLATGGSLHVADRLDDLWLTARVRDEHITRLVTVPAAVDALTDAAVRDPERCDGIELIVTGGAALSTRSRARVADTLPHAQTIGYFGTGELGFIGDDRAGEGSIRLYPRVKARVRDDEGVNLAPGELGTLWVRSPSCSHEYLPGTTRQPLTDADGWATVQDQGRLRGRDFTFVGRQGDVITTGGHTVALDEVERAFEGMPGVGAVCAITETDDRLGARIALVVEGEPPPRGELLAHAREHLAPASVPRRWYTLPKLPRTAGGKIRRAAVTDLLSREQGRR